MINITNNKVDNYPRLSLLEKDISDKERGKAKIKPIVLGWN